MNFVFKTVAGPPASGPERVTALDDETRDNPVKRKSVVELTGCQIQEICSRHRSFGGKDRCLDVSFDRVNDNPNIFEHLNFTLPLQMSRIQEEIEWRRIYKKRFA